jgi:hypothetical protein
MFFLRERQFSDCDANYKWKMWAQISPKLGLLGIKKEAVAELMQLNAWTINGLFCHAAD